MSRITVYYDGACPTCQREMRAYKRLVPSGRIHWFDITGEEEQLRQEGIDPEEALHNLHIRRTDGELVTGIDAFIILWRQSPLLRPIAWLAALKPAKALMERYYGPLTRRRLRRSGRCDTEHDR